MKRVFAFLIFGCLLLDALLGQSNSLSRFYNDDFRFHFKYYTSLDGLPQNSVNDIERDQFGFVWFATGNGLSRFDGYGFRNFTKPQLPSNLVNALVQAPDGKLWIGTKSGLCYYDVGTEHIELFSDVNVNGATVPIVSLCCDSFGNIWAGSNEGGLFLIKPSGTGFSVVHFTVQGGKIPGNYVGSIRQLKNGSLLVGTNHGIVRYDYKNDSFLPWQSQALSNSLVLSIFEAQNGELWIGSFYGVYVVDGRSSQGRWYLPDPFDANSLSHGRVNEITQDPFGNIYLGTLGGLNIYRPESNNFLRVPTEQNQRYSTNSRFVNCLFADAQGNIWVGTEKGGINQFNVFQKPFYSLVSRSNVANSLSNNTINSIFVDGSDFWIGTAGGGLNHYDASGQRFTHYRYNPSNASSIASDFVTSIAKLPNGDLWVGTWGGGVCKMMKNGTFKRFMPPVNNPETNNVNAFVSCLMADEGGLLFVGTEGGLAVLELASETFMSLDATSNALTQVTEIGCLLKDSKGFVWAGTRNGLFRFSGNMLNQPFNAIDPASQVQVFKSGSMANNERTLPGGYIISLAEDASGTIWAGTYGDGLLKCIPDGSGSFTFQQFTSRDGLCNNVVYAIQQDADGFLWLSTDMGLARLDAKSGQFENFFTEDGLLGDQFYWSASFKDNKGMLYFGGVDGLNYFNPAAFKQNNYQANIEITAIRAFNQPIGVGEGRHGKVAFAASLSKVDEVVLSHKDNVFSVEFAALDYHQPKKIKYAYKLDGVDNTWVEVGANQRLAHYTNLKGGTYLFNVKSTNSDGVWGDQVKQVKIVVVPPFWQTPWFTWLTVFVIVAVAVVYSRYHSRRLIMQKAKLERMVHERTEQIEAQRDTLEKQASELMNANKALEQRQALIEGQKEELESMNEELSQQRDQVMELNAEIERNNQLRLRFFTNISHEFRTPLTLIVSPIERLLKELNLSKPVKDTLLIVHRNARRLHLLIDQLLTFRRIETGNLRLAISQGDVSLFAADVFHAFDELALQRQVKYQFINQLSSPQMWFDREKVEDILYNLLSNAFKYSPEKSQITLQLSDASIEIDGHSARAFQIDVFDTGIGIPSDALPFIFDNFYRISPQQHINGSGIGLALTAELVDAMNGRIEVQSDLGKGCRFTIKLPCEPGPFGNAVVVDGLVDGHSDLEGKVQVIHDSFRDDDHFLFENRLEDASEKPTLLVVEDNKELTTFLFDAFQEHYNVLVAENGKVGYELARKQSPDIVLSDVMMPEMDGLSLCKSIKSNLYTSHIPVVLLTAKALVEQQLEGLHTGADDYIAKPFNLDVLKVKLANLVESRSKLRAKFCGQTEWSPTDATPSTLDEKFLAKAYNIMETHFANPEFNVELFSELMYVSRSLLYKKLKALVDLSPNDFVTVFRLKKSLTLLASKDVSVNEVAYSIGFNDPKYFSRVFKKFYNKTPSEYVAG